MLLRLAAWVLAAALAAAGGADARLAGSTPRPLYMDPALAGWTAPMETLCFQAGCGEYYYVAGVYLGERGELHVVCRSQITLRRFDRRHLGRFAEKLAQALAPMVEDLARRGVVTGVVLTFYCVLLKDNVLGLEVYESCLPAHAFGALGPVPLRVVERRVEELPPP
ncbi:MAG: hypothetical protein ACYDA8_18500 [Deferrisomatales bacterium]